MSFGKAVKQNFKKWASEEDGNFAMIWAAFSLIGILAFGAFHDYTMMSKTKMNAQNMADTMALNASVAVDQLSPEDRKKFFDKNIKFVPPNSYKENVFYTYKEVMGRDPVGGGNLKGKVLYNVEDPNDPNFPMIAKATIVADYSPPIMGAFKGQKSREFGVVSDVSYALEAGSPASIFFIVDNSGSMNWTDTSGAVKLTSLKESMQGFMDLLHDHDNNRSDIFRTALYPYSQDYDGNNDDISDNGLLDELIIEPKWGTIEDDIDAMEYAAGTDSSGAMEKAATDMAGEDAIHKGVDEKREALKFAILMSDGSNNQSAICQDHYYHERSGTVSLTRPTRYASYYKHFPAGEYYGPTIDRDQVNANACVKSYYADTETLAACQELKDGGTKVYAIGYDLREGYNCGMFPDRYGRLVRQCNYVYAADVTRAEDMLESCATDEDTYILASDAESLDEAFQTIGAQIIQEVIRVKR